MRRIKLSLFRDDMSIYVENPKESIKLNKNLLELNEINVHNKDKGYKVNIKKVSCFLYTSYEQLVFEINIF